MTVSEEDPRIKAGEAIAGLETVVSADFVRLHTRAIPDSLVAAGLLARYCYEQGIPFHVSTRGVTTPVPEDRDVSGDGTVEVALAGGTADTDGPVCYRVYELLSEHDATPDSLYTLAGIAAADYDPATVAPSILDAAIDSEEPGIGVPTTDRVMGLAYSTHQHTDYSGDVEATRSALEAFGISNPAAATPKEHASFAAVTSVTSAVSTNQSATDLNRFLKPHMIDHPYQSIEGYSDIIQTLSQPHPDLVLALAFPTPDYELIQSNWQTYAEQAHNAVQTATPTATDYYYRADIDTDYPLMPARLLSYHTTNPTVIASTDTHVALNTRNPPLPPGFETATSTVNGTSLTTHNSGLAVIPNDTRDDFFKTLEETYQ